MKCKHLTTIQILGKSTNEWYQDVVDVNVECKATQCLMSQWLCSIAILCKISNADRCTDKYGAILKFNKIALDCTHMQQNSKIEKSLSQWCCWTFPKIWFVRLWTMELVISSTRTYRIWCPKQSRYKLGTNSWSSSEWWKQQRFGNW